MKIIYQRFSIFAIILSMALLSGCRNESISPLNLNDENSKEVGFTFSLKADKLGDTNNDVKNGDKQEIRPEDIKIYIFRETTEKNADGTNIYKFFYSPKLRELFPVGELYHAIFRIPDDLGEGSTGNVKLMVLGNYTGTSNPKDFANLEEFKKSLILDLSGKFSHTVAIPYMGITPGVDYPQKQGENFPTVTLLRCLARVIVEIDSSITKKSPDRRTYMIKSINSIRVYRTSNKATIYFNESEEYYDGKKVLKPTIAPDAEYNLNDGKSTKDIIEADKQPLLYEGDDLIIKTVDKNNQITEEAADIFVPGKVQKTKENEKVTPGALNKAMAIVVGLKLMDKDEKEVPGIRYYRVDIANYDNDAAKKAKKPKLPTSLKDVLRNYTYSIRLEGAWDTGSNTPDDALTGGVGLFVTVKDWDEERLDYDINGQYIFGIQSSNLQLPWKKNSLEIPIIYTLTPENAKNAFSFSWKDKQGNVTKESKIFKAEFDIASKKLKISTNNDNPTNNDITEQLSVRFLNHSFTFKVTQLHKSAQYTIGPETTVKGVYVYGKPNPSDNKVTFRLYAKKLSNGQYAKLDGLKFHVASDTIDGYSIVKDDTFNAIITPKDGSAPYQVVTAQVSGIATQPKDKILTLKTDADQRTYATAKIPLAFRPKKVLVLYGKGVPKDDKLYINNKDFKELMKGNDNGEGVNFGLEEGSVVKAEPITFIETTDENLASVINSVHPDIIIHSKEYELDQQDEDAIIQFMNSNPTSISGRGVFISTNTANVHHLLKDRLDLFSQKKFEGRWMQDNWYEKTDDDGTYHYTADRRLFGMKLYDDPDDNNTIDLGYRYRITNSTKDKLINGPFGDIGGLWWRAGNGTNGCCITFPIKEKILQYSGMVPFASGKENRIRERYDYGTTFLRAKSYPLVWIGFDNIGLSKGTEGNNDVNNPYDVYAWKFENGKSVNAFIGTYACTEKGIEPNYATIVSTGIVLGNILYWAMYTSEYGI